MYSEYFGLEEMPFSIAPDPRYIYMSDRHREALAHLLYGINSDSGFVLLTGDIGTGKTTICRCLLEQVPENSEIAFIVNPKLTVEELLATICDEFGINYSKDNKSIKVFVDLINTYLLEVHTRGHKAILIIDEAQNLSAEVLEQLRLLTNLETSQSKLLQIVLLGQPELRDMVSRPELEQLAQRITARYHLGPLSQKDVASYVTHRLSVAGLKKQIFPASTIRKLYRLSKGVPRLINVLCDRALLGAFVQSQGWVKKSTLSKAAREVFGNAAMHETTNTTSGWLAATLVLTILGTLLLFPYNNFYNEELLSIAAVKSEPPTLKPQPAVKKSDPQVLHKDILRPPAEQPEFINLELAFQEMFRHWNVSYLPHESITACQQAEAQGLRCLDTRGSLNSLRRLNRPAVLKLFDDQNMEFYATLISLKDEEAVFVVGSETKKIAVKDIALQWFGDYTMLWRMPPEYQSEILPGYQGPEIQWLEKQLALLKGLIIEPRENAVYDDTLIRQVKNFQLAQGLVPDGIVGAQTIIHLNTAVGDSIPKLIDRQEDN